MLYMSIFLIPLMLGAVTILLLPEVVKKNSVVKIGTIINRKYDLEKYDLIVQAELRKGPRSRRYWRVLIYAYEKCNPHVCVGTHMLPVSGFRKSAEKKKARIEALLRR